MLYPKLSQQEVKDVLDSDDEFPSSYNEEPSLPAFENDTRFDPIVFKWVQNPVNNIKQSNNNNLIPQKHIKKGLLTQKDLICLKSIAEHCNDNLLWMVDFFVHKDIESTYRTKFKGCLVANFPETSRDIPIKDMNTQYECKTQYKLVVKV